METVGLGRATGAKMLVQKVRSFQVYSSLFGLCLEETARGLGDAL